MKRCANPACLALIRRGRCCSEACIRARQAEGARQARARTAYRNRARLLGRFFDRLPQRVTREDLMAIARAIYARGYNTGYMAAERAAGRRKRPRKGQIAA